MEGRMEKKHKIIIKTQVLKLMQNGEWKDFIDSVIEEGSNVVNIKKINGYTLLSCASEYGDKEIVEYLMQNGAKSNATNFNGSIPLHIAAKHGHIDLLEFFINLSVCVDSRDYMNRTPLHYVTDQFDADKEVFISGYDKYYYSAITVGDCSNHEDHIELVSLLLRHGADIDATDSRGNVPLFYAVMHTCTEVVEMLIRRGANVSKFWDADKWTVLHYASYFGWLNVVRCLVERKVDLNAETLRGDTPLLLAAKRSHMEVVELLVKSGANVSSRGMLKTTALHFATQKGWLNVVQLLAEYKADINARTCSGATPVMLAVKHKHSDIFDYLVKCGADLIGCEGKTTILHFACDVGLVDVVQTLVDGGSDIDAQTPEGFTPLLIAAMCCEKEIVNILLESGASLHTHNPNNPNSYSLLHYVCENGWIDIVVRFVEAGLDINIKNYDGETPLHSAVKYGQLEISMDLLEAGADVNLKTLNGITPLYLAVNMNKMEMAVHFLKCGANCNEDNGHGTPLECYVDLGEGLEYLPLFIENGACITNYINRKLMNNSYFKEKILKNAGVCKQAILNKFNNLDLPKIYQVPFAVKNLPPIKGMKIVAKRYAAECIEETVIRDIDTNGFCNLTVIQPIVLSLLSAKAFIQHFTEGRNDQNAIFQ